MKTDPTPTPTGRVYWKSLDELAETAEFRQWIEREFPEGATEWTDPVSRRHFVKIMGASFLLAGLGLGATGCRKPEQQIIPFSKQPEGYIHGLPQYYATAMPSHGSALPLVVKSHEGRPTKIEGNDQHPDSKGATDRWAQASILNLYDPDRAARFLQGGTVAPVAGAQDYLAQLGTKAAQNGGEGLCFLLEPNNSPTRTRLQGLLSEKCPKAKWFVHDSVDLSMPRKAATALTGVSAQQSFAFDQADVVLSLDSDFLGSEEYLPRVIREFTGRRHVRNPEDPVNRLYVVESLMTVTGFAADHRLRLPSSLVGALAISIAKGILPPGLSSTLGNVAALAGVDPKWSEECAKDLLTHKGRSLVVAGHRQPMAVHLVALAMNMALGNIGKTVFLTQTPPRTEGSLQELAQALDAGEVQTLVILGSNPAYTAPADLDWASKQKKAKQIARLAYYEDETSNGCTWHFPEAHFLEAWGDAFGSDGSLLSIQPLIAPLFGGWTEIEVLARIAGVKTASPYDLVRETFASFTQDNGEAVWRHHLHAGFIKSERKAVEPALKGDVIAESLKGINQTAPDKSRLEVVFHRDYSLDDGRYNNNGWLQELPDPVTKIVWDNAVLMSRRTAQELGVKNSEVVEVQLGGRTVEGPVWVQPGMADYSLGLALGYGRPKPGRVGVKAGFNAYALRTSDGPNFALGASIRRTGKSYLLACTQSHWSLEGRPIIREANLEQYKAHPDFAKRMDLEKPPVYSSLYPNPLDQLEKKGLHQWGMSIDLNQCVGCSACVIACQSENNVPIVGKEQVNKGREMHWLRIDRYYAGKPTAEAGSAQAKENLLQTFRRDEEQQFDKWIDDPQAVTQPMLCQHCEAAPCENVCPVNATVHDQEGLNLMAYNRCVGTRYCSNNCPYKVRRFNFFDYNKRPLNALYKGPLASRPADEWDLRKMIANPDVTVRMRGVMEKCTFCVQRIEQAKIAQKTKSGASGNVVVPEGTFTTACSQACPAGAIVFGNINDPESAVSKRKNLDRDYSVLDFLYTRPRLTYLARVRNPNPHMPDYYSAPMTFREYEQKMGNPFKHEGPGETGHGAVKEPVKGGH